MRSSCSPTLPYLFLNMIQCGLVIVPRNVPDPDPKRNYKRADTR